MYEGHRETHQSTRSTQEEEGDAGEAAPGHSANDCAQRRLAAIALEHDSSARAPKSPKGEETEPGFAALGAAPSDILNGDGNVIRSIN